MRRLTFFGALSLFLLTQSACAASAPTPPPSLLPPRAQTFPQFLGSSVGDIVVVGTVISSAEKSRGFLRDTTISHLDVTEIRLRVESVLKGVVEDSVLAVVLEEQGYGKVLGHQVLVWAHREYYDLWNLWGRMGLIEGGYITDGRGAPVFRNTRTDANDPIRLSDVMDLVSKAPTAALTQNSTSELFKGAAIALVRVASIDYVDGVTTYHVEPIGWIRGSETAIPTTIIMPSLPSCLPRTVRGDSMVVPVPASRGGPTLRVKQCTDGLRVKDGFLPGLGVSLGEIDRALTAVGSKYYLRAMLKPE